MPQAGANVGPSWAQAKSQREERKEATGTSRQEKLLLTWLPTGTLKS